jgi:uncharacterized phage protein (TIGR01671 family)
MIRSDGMGRVIEFRGWDKNSNEMLSMEDLLRFEVLSESCPLIDVLSYGGSSIELMQFTGLNDKNGVKIFEGDVVRFNLRGSDDLQPRYGEIGAVHITKYGPAFGGWASEYCNNIEILGNIHQNPELLEKK